MDGPRHPLIVTEDPALLDDLRRVAAAAATEITVARTPEQALRSWHRAPLVVVGPDLEPALRGSEPEPGPRPILVTRSLDPRPLPTRTTGPREPSSDSGPRPPADRRGDVGALSFALPRDEAALVELFSSIDERGTAPVVSVIGGRGGAGASLLTIALALAAGRAGRDTALLDADPLGHGPDVHLGPERSPSSPRTGWGDLADRRSRTPWRILREGLPRAGPVSVLTWARGDEDAQGLPLPAGTARSVLDSARRGADLVVVDLPRSFDPATRALLNGSDLVLMVVPADVRSVLSASRMVGRLRRETDRLRLVVRGAREEVPASVVARNLRVELDADLPPEPGLSRALAAGEVPARHPRSPMARYAHRVVSLLLDRREAG
ncbi:septum site-determining protein Ssd [Nocardiopsis alba]|uniref:septum site-determining protein Ssd n=1 Tax=Nocardiopsis alba TaxID=53437 RepID=UPI000345249B|nr:septum site-determining protein Ssd [Nocardiopsis alba]